MKRKYKFVLRLKLLYIHFNLNYHMIAYKQKNTFIFFKDIFKDIFKDSFFFEF